MPANGRIDKQVKSQSGGEGGKIDFNQSLTYTHPLRPFTTQFILSAPSSTRQRKTII